MLHVALCGSTQGAGSSSMSMVKSSPILPITTFVPANLQWYVDSYDPGPKPGSNASPAHPRILPQLAVRSHDLPVFVPLPTCGTCRGISPEDLDCGKRPSSKCHPRHCSNS